MRYIFSFLVVIGFATPGTAQDFDLQSSEMSSFIDSLFNKGIENKLIPGGIIGVIHKGETIHSKAYGLSDIASNQIADFYNTRFQLGSVGKLFTAISVLKEVERGNLELNRNVNDYLKDFQLTTIGNKPVTLHHLLTHTAGLNERVIGYGTPNVEDIESLGVHLKRRFPTPYTVVGKEISYSNYGFGLAGHLVELSSGKSFKEYIQAEILNVLGMDSTTYRLPNGGDNSFAKGYEVREQFNPVKLFPKHVSPAGGIAATGADLQKFIDAILREDERLLNRESFNLIKEQQATPHPLLSGHAYGIEMQNFNGHIGFGKGGNIPGFLAFVMFLPQYEFGMFIAVNTETDNFLEAFMAAFKERFFPRQLSGMKVRMGHINFSDFAGDFRANRYNRNTIEDMFALFSGSTTIYNDKDSALSLYHNGDWQYYKPVGDSVFQNTLKPELYLVFEKSNGEITKMHRNINIGGFSIPMTFEKVPWYSTGNFLNEQAGLFPFMNLSYLLFPLGWLTIFFVRKRRANFMKDRGFKNTTRVVLSIFSLLTLINVLVFIKLIRLGNDLIFGVPPSIVFMQGFSYLIPVLLVMVCYRLFKAWKTREGMLGSRIYFSLYTIAAIAYTIILHQWHFIGMNF